MVKAKDSEYNKKNINLTKDHAESSTTSTAQISINRRVDGDGNNSNSVIAMDHLLVKRV